MKKCGLTKTLHGYFINTVNIKIVQIMNRLSKLIIKKTKKIQCYTRYTSIVTATKYHATKPI